MTLEKLYSWTRASLFHSCKVMLIIIKDSFKTGRCDVDTGTERGGNNAHLSPEVLNARPGPRKTLNYSKQPVWAAGVLAHELAGHPNPFQKGTIDQRGYSIDQVPPLNSTYCKHANFCKPLPRAFTTLVTSMLQPEARDRPSLSDCLKKV